MHFINRLNQARNDRPLLVGSGHDAYRDRPPPEPWQVGWTPPPIPADVEAERLLAFNIVHHWRPEATDESVE